MIIRFIEFLFQLFGWAVLGAIGLIGIGVFVVWAGQLLGAILIAAFIGVAIFVALYVICSIIGARWK